MIATGMCKSEKQLQMECWPRVMMVIVLAAKHVAPASANAALQRVLSKEQTVSCSCLLLQLITVILLTLLLQHTCTTDRALVSAMQQFSRWQWEELLFPCVHCLTFASVEQPAVKVTAGNIKLLLSVPPMVTTTNQQPVQGGYFAAGEALPASILGPKQNSFRLSLHLAQCMACETALPNLFHHLLHIYFEIPKKTIRVSYPFQLACFLLFVLFEFFL